MDDCYVALLRYEPTGPGGTGRWPFWGVHLFSEQPTNEDVGPLLGRDTRVVAVWGPEMGGGTIVDHRESEEK